MENFTSLKQLIQKMMPKGNGIIIGKVISLNPVKVQALNDEKLVVTPIISKRFIDEPLQIGELVYMLSFADSKKYYTLDRAVI